MTTTTTVIEDDEIVVDDDDELIEDDDYAFPNGPKLSGDERLIHTLLTTTMLRAVLEGTRFPDEGELLKLDKIMKPLVGGEIRAHPHNIEDTKAVLKTELRKLNRLIVERLRAS